MIFMVHFFILLILSIPVSILLIRVFFHYFFV